MPFDRRQKSFGEPTRVRMDGSVAAVQGDDAARARPANTAYERYKQELHAFFNGEKPLPGNLKEMLATRPGAAEHGLVEETPSAVPVPVKRGKKGDERGDKKVRRVVNGPSDDVLAIVEQIRRANSPREVTVAVDALRGKGASLPKGDAEVLSKALSHGSEDVIAEALSGLVEVDIAQIKSATLLKTRVRNVMLLAGTNEVKDLAGKMLARLG